MSDIGIAPAPASPPTDAPNQVMPVPPPSAPTYPNTDIGLRQWFRSNIEWVIKETDLHTIGASQERREADNPVNPNL